MKKLKPVIAVDADDTLWDFSGAFTRYHNRMYGSAVRFEDIRDYEWADAYGCGEAELVGRIDRFCESDKHGKLQPMPGCREVLRQLSEDYILHLLTARGSQSRRRTMDLLDAHFSGLFSEHHFVGRGGSKAQMCLEHGVHSFIDDALHHAESAIGATRVYLFDRPWNRVPHSSGITRVHSWDELYAHLR